MKASHGMATDKVTEYIRSKLITGAWKSGDRLPTEAELCAQIGVSRTCVREAIKVLEASHIVEIRRGDGTYLCYPDQISLTGPLLFKIILKETVLQELYDFRESIEMGVLRLVICKATPEDIEKLKDCNRRLKEFVDSGSKDVQTLYNLDIEFHRHLAAATHNTIMCDIYQFTFDIFAPLILRNYEKGQDAQSALETHLDIVSAVETGDFLQVGHAIRSSVGLWSAWLTHEDASKVVLTDLWNVKAEDILSWNKDENGK